MYGDMSVVEVTERDNYCYQWTIEESKDQFTYGNKREINSGALYERMLEAD